MCPSEAKSNVKRVPSGAIVATVPDAKPATDGNAPPPSSRAQVIPLPATPLADADGDEAAPQPWQPPKEIIWMGHPRSVLALSRALASRIAEPDRSGAHLVVHAGTSTGA